MSGNPQHLNSMHKTYGVGPLEARCGQCAFCVDVRRDHPSRGSVTNYVCKQAPSRVTGHGVRNWPMWLKGWQACGKFRDSDV